MTGTSGTTYVYMGDRWISGAITNSSYVWLPLTVSGTTLSLPWVNNWAINVSTGAWTNDTYTSLKDGRLPSTSEFKLRIMPRLREYDGAGTQAQGVYCSVNTYQQWEITASGSDYKITNDANGYLLEDEGNSKTAGARWIRGPATEAPTRSGQLPATAPETTP